MVIYEQVLRAFQEQKVRYVLVGGIAFNLLGGLRSTSDLDILVEMSDGNLAKMVRILKKQGYSVKQPVDPMEITKKRVREEWIKKKYMKAFNFYKDDGLKEVDIIIDSPVSFEEAKKDAILIKAGKLRLRVIAIDKLIKMKKVAGRDIDKIDISELKIIKQFRKKR